MLAGIRDYFADTGALEVETPILSAGATLDRWIDSFHAPGGGWLQTSPEFAMKRLLASGSGDIYQVARVFRVDEAGAQHNPEFTMLEWYRLDWDHQQLMGEVQALIQQLGGPTGDYPRFSYAEAFARARLPDPHTASVAQLVEQLRQRGDSVPETLAETEEERDSWLQLLLDTLVLPEMPKKQPWFLHAFPASQAALARVTPGPPACASRFELIWDGLELANGFHELNDMDEQAARFAGERGWRAEHQRVQPPADLHLIQALEHGLPDCAGVAMGLDRLLMRLTGARHIDQVLAFPHARA